MKVKRKGFYEYQNLGWHQNQSSLVIPMAAEAQLVHGIPLEEFIHSHLAKDPEKNIFDFMLRTKVPRNSKLILEMQDGMEFEQQNICRYYPCKTGGKLFKLMPALKGKEEEGPRRLSIESKWHVKTCNDMKDAVDFATEVDYDYYITEAKKLIVGSVEAKEALQNAGSSVDEDEEDE
jgi:hypothetical protein